MRTFRDIVTAVVYSYITTEFQYAKRDSGHLAFGGVMLQRFEFTKVCMENFSRNFDIFAIKIAYLNALLSFLLSTCFSARSRNLLSELSLFEFPKKTVFMHNKIQCIRISNLYLAST